MEENQILTQRAVLVGLYQGLKDEFDIRESMNELAELTLAAGAEVADIIIQNKASIEAATFIGAGKVEEVKMAIQDTESNIVIFNDELSGAQIRNLENLLETTVIDRTALILDIFAVRAQTKIAKLQVELAQLRYRASRLTGLGASLSRTGGGIGTRGPGEQKLEIDRRRINERIDEIRKQIKESEKNRTVQRKLRKKMEVPVVALVGYTNAGKSSILNYFINHSIEGEPDKQVFEKDMLFATLDTFARRIVLEDKKEFILTDTVGFVSKLPHSIIDAFKATLEEALGADILLHVVDASNDSYKMQMEVTKQVLNELHAGDKEMITVFNKMDLVPDKVIGDLEESVHISAKTGENIALLVEKIKTHLFSHMKKVIFVIPYTDGKAASYICETYKVDKIDHLEMGTYIETEVSEADYNKYKHYLKIEE
ncbi:GTPase HflX [Fusibacter ferrireducens]|uniref:GTPase HflX n=1 Tax=Fusibacter ferrireducens TaxID=2785058 RepID=A0ABR9ZTQ4_9FIRM|nr:GTPase HflX [Fusibacter ferrireducens]MBF4693827.1 GTPase HflX [Fusibacter ferrireducens]